MNARDPHRLLAALVLAVGGFILCGASLGAQTLPAAAVQAGASTGVSAHDAPPASAYVLGPDDQITLHVVDAPEVSDKPQRIDPNGDLKLPMVGRIHAAGKTIDQLEADLRQRLAEYMTEPDVSVTVSELHAQTVSVIGAVANAGIHPIRARETLIDLLSEAGGVRADAGPIVRVVRRGEWARIPLPEAISDPATGISVVEIDVKSLLSAAAPEKNIALLPNDVVSVPVADEIFVVGEVGHAGPVTLSRGSSATIMEAVSASGGLTRMAAPTRARVLRFDVTTQTRTEVPVDIKKIMAGTSADIAMVAGDILVVPDSTGKRASNRAVEIMIQMGTMIATYGIIH